MRLRRTVGFAIAAAMAGIASGAGATEFYNASTPRTPPASSDAYYYNPGPHNVPPGNHVLFDDITVLTPFNEPLFNVKKVTIRVSQLGFAPSANVTAYYANLVPDLPGNYGPGDGPDFDPVNLQTFGSVFPVPANPLGTARTVDISFGSGLTTLFNVSGAPAAKQIPPNQYRSFALGMKFSTTDDKNGWTVADYEDNLDLLWDYNLNDTTFAEFTYSHDGNGDIIGTQFIKVEGYVLSGVGGDATIDGRVDIDDLYALATHWKLPGDYVQGDFDFNGFVDENDLGILAVNWQASGGPLGPALEAFGLPSVVPEPVALCLLPLAFTLVARRRR